MKREEKRKQECRTNQATAVVVAVPCRRARAAALQSLCPSDPMSSSYQIRQPLSQIRHQGGEGEEEGGEGERGGGVEEGRRRWQRLQLPHIAFEGRPMVAGDPRGLDPPVGRPKPSISMASEADLAAHGGEGEEEGGGGGLEMRGEKRAATARDPLLPSGGWIHHRGEGSCDGDGDGERGRWASGRRIHRQGDRGHRIRRPRPPHWEIRRLIGRGRRRRHGRGEGVAAATAHASGGGGQTDARGERRGRAQLGFVPVGEIQAVRPQSDDRTGVEGRAQWDTWTARSTLRRDRMVDSSGDRRIINQKCRGFCAKIAEVALLILQRSHDV
ncbi:hypothetical protein OsI_14854 [Oryza sativa Indica Group]|uniref:Uncharacterized protein n=1 Tax=Oryza sativa subsp. indica TaxID=39946 RepID=A2XQE3_ORYSI|nr:hypothetical protein OsI_14854 [Oryza sativa Indica Group]